LPRLAITAPMLEQGLPYEVASPGRFHRTQDCTEVLSQGYPARAARPWSGTQQGSQASRSVPGYPARVARVDQEDRSAKARAEGATLRLDAIDLIGLLRTVTPYQRSRRLPTVWTLPRLERQYKEKVGRPGSWRRFSLTFRTFLSLFPKTFQLFGPEDEYARLYCTTRLVPVEGDDEVLKRLEKLHQTGHTGHMRLTQQRRHPGLRDEGQCCVCLQESECRLCVTSSRPPSAGCIHTPRSSSRPSSSRRTTPSTPRSYGARPASALSTGRPTSATSSW